MSGQARVDEITFEKNVVVADVGYWDLPNLEVLRLDGKHRSEARKTGKE